MSRPKTLTLRQDRHFGRLLFYPDCPESARLADLLKVKSFSESKLSELKSLGYVINLKPMDVRV